MRKPKSYNITPARGQALLNYQGRIFPKSMDLFEAEVVEEVKRKKNNQLDLRGKQKELNPDFRNLLLHGDCLSACAYLKSQDIKIDLVYIDPPFASGANYAKKVYLRNGNKTEFENDDSSIGEEIMYGDIWQKEDYLNWFYERLLAIRETMSEKASIYVHLDWHIGHYVKVLLDEVFGEENLINEIIWSYDQGARGKDNFAKKHDTIFFYSKSNEKIFNVKDILASYESGMTKWRYTKGGQAGKEMPKGKVPSDVWDIRFNSMAERTGYNTEKPEELIEKIIKASSDEGMIIADFFSGSGTTAKVVNDLGRKFVVCDIGVNAIQTTRDRLAKAGAGFDVLKIKDGVRLFRNPAQTTQKIFSLIDGFAPRAELELSEFWDGGIVSKKGGFEPVKFIGIDKKLTKESLDAILEEIYALEDSENGASKANIIYAHKDLEVDQSYVNKEIRNSGKTTISVDLISLDDLLSEKRDALFAEDNAEIEVKKQSGKCGVKIKKYFSPYLKTKINEYNNRKAKKDTLEENLKENKEKEIKISDSGLELIESVQFDTELKKSGVWTSNRDLEDKAEIKDKIKGVYELPTAKFKIKIRNIAGDEIILDYSK